MVLLQSKWPVPTRSALSHLILVLCIHRITSFQPRSPLVIPPRSPTRPIIGKSGSVSLYAVSNNGISDTTEEDDRGGPEPNNDKDNDRPDLIQPFLPAMDSNYSARGPVGGGDFTISRSGPPTATELSNEQMLQIVNLECTDLEVNTLVWKCLGYRYSEDNTSWSPVEVFPKWKERFPDPPDFIGMKRVYSKEVDQASLRSNQALVRSIPNDNKQSLKTYLKPLGWKGFQLKGLTPNKTRRAQCANWLIYYREELFGYTIEELKERRRLKRQAEEAAAVAEEAKRLDEDGGGKKDDWKYPLKEVY